MIIKVAHADPAQGGPVAFDVLGPDDDKVIRTIVIRPHQFELVETNGLVLREVSMAVVEERVRASREEAAARQKQIEEDRKLKADEDRKSIKDRVAEERAANRPDETRVEPPIPRVEPPLSERKPDEGQPGQLTPPPQMEKRPEPVVQR